MNFLSPDNALMSEMISEAEYKKRLSFVVESFMKGSNVGENLSMIKIYQQQFESKQSQSAENLNQNLINHHQIKTERNIYKANNELSFNDFTAKSNIQPLLCQNEPWDQNFSDEIVQVTQNHGIHIILNNLNFNLSQ